MRVNVKLYVNGGVRRNWDFIHQTQGVPERSEVKLDIRALAAEIHGYEQENHILSDRLVLTIETHPE